MANKAEHVRELRKAVERYTHICLVSQPLENVSGDVEWWTLIKMILFMPRTMKITWYNLFSH